MEYKLLEEKDLELMLDFVDDKNTKYNIEDLKKFKLCSILYVVIIFLVYFIKVNS